MKKNILHSIVSCVLTVVLSCQNEIHQTDQENLRLIFNSSVGEPISAATAASWIERHNKQSAASRNGQIYSVTQIHLQAMMLSTPDLVGFTFHHALDNLGKHHILIVPIDNTLRLWTSSQRVLLDTNVDSEIDLNTARNWIDNYATVNPNAIRYHFFGTDIFQDIVQSPEFQIEEAINDEQIPQLLLLVQSSAEDSENGRTSSDYEAFDASARCPLACLD